MASHITISPSNPGLGAGKSANGASGSAGDDVFAALLGAAGAKSEPKSEPKSEAAAVPVKPTGDEVTIALGFRKEDNEKPEDPTLIAAAIDATVPIVTPEPVKPELTALIEGLAKLKARLEAGETLDGKELERLDALLSQVAKGLNIDLSKLPSPEELTALLAGTGAAEDSFANTLTAALGPLASALLGDPKTDGSIQMDAQVKSVSDKLAAILSALNHGDVDADHLASLQASAETDIDLKAALDRLTKPSLAADAAPVLATPTLALKETALTGKTSVEAAPVVDNAGDAEVDSAKTSEPTLQVQSAGKDSDQTANRDNDTDKGSDDNKPSDAKPVATAASSAPDKQPDTNVTAQSAPAARAEVVAAPRVVQAGYQTSQQQLNLPQLAFEMVRQVGEGNTRFQIRLDPAELGRIDVRLDIDASGQVNARLTVEKAETLDLMQRDQKGLERALQQAGLDSSKTNLEFSLKQNPFSGGGGQQGQDGNARNNLFGIEAVEVDEAPLPTVNLYRGNLSASGVNIVA